MVILTMVMMVAMVMMVTTWAARAARATMMVVMVMVMMVTPGANYLLQITICQFHRYCLLSIFAKSSFYCIDNT
jgi:hypothetical protein